MNSMTIIKRIILIIFYLFNDVELIKSTKIKLNTRKFCIENTDALLQAVWHVFLLNI